MDYLSAGIKEALSQRKVEKEKAGQEKLEKASAKVAEQEKTENAPQKESE